MGSNTTYSLYLNKMLIRFLVLFVLLIAMPMIALRAFAWLLTRFGLWAVVVIPIAVYLMITVLDLVLDAMDAGSQPPLGP